MTSQDANRPFSQFVEFVVHPGQQDSLVTALTERSDRFIRTYPGFIRASVQVSEDHQRVLSHVLWQSKSACEQAFKNVEQGDGDFWALLHQHGATAMSFNAYELQSEVVGAR